MGRIVSNLRVWLFSLWCLRWGQGLGLITRKLAKSPQPLTPPQVYALVVNCPKQAGRLAENAQETGWWLGEQIKESECAAGRNPGQRTSARTRELIGGINWGQTPLMQPVEAEAVDPQN
ncbi:hypothetical protein B9Z38_03615 [Limnohabitans sp. MMS-10A-160]|nr:hypothetical protein B9Z43_13410 [Limnohabitans sp. MMS-10A-192]PUE27373.1 hypothetical protein B9Z38_03615 [Limnohabitans sp. MMS-10A-160]